MEDDEYDTLEEIVRRDGENELVDKVGWKPSADGTKLPYCMPSLKKIKPGESSSFFQKTSNSCKGSTYNGSWILTDKLDGVSALWTGTHLYMRGNGIIGRDITAYIKSIKGLLPLNGANAIRGEICLTKEKAADGQGPARSQVNGWLHRDDITKNINAIFIAYEIHGVDKLTRKQQLIELHNLGFQTPWNQCINQINDDILSKILLDRKEKTIYDIDGIVIGTSDDYEQPSNTADAPKTQVAFKMPLAEQCAITQIVQIEWNTSRLGYLMPRVQIKPVEIGGTRIEWVTGHNAEYIMKQSLGPESTIKVRRSGDVIPIIDTVITSASEPQMPEGEWIWDGVNAKAMEGGEEQEKKKLLHTLKTLKIDGAGPAAVEAIWKYGIRTLTDILNWSDRKATEAIGPTLGPRLIERTRIAIGDASLETIITAVPLSRGTGLTKIKAAIDKEPNITKWSNMTAPSGWSRDTWVTFIKDLPRIIAIIDSWGRPINSFNEPQEQQVTAISTAKGQVCFTGFRDAELESKSVLKGYSAASGVKKGLTALIIPDTEDPETYNSSKAEKARQYNIPILCKSKWKSYINV